MAQRRGPRGDQGAAKTQRLAKTIRIASNDSSTEPNGFIQRLNGQRSTRVQGKPPHFCRGEVGANQVETRVSSDADVIPQVDGITRACQRIRFGLPETAHDLSDIIGAIEGVRTRVSEVQ